MQNLLNRTMPLFDGGIDVRDKHVYPGRRRDFKLGKIVLVSSCSFWDIVNFDKLAYVIEELSKVLDVDFVGAVLRPHADVLMGMTRKGADVAHVLDAAREAGRQSIRNKRISGKILEAVASPLVSRNQYLKRSS